MKAKDETTDPLAEDIAVAWKLLEQDTGDTSSGLANLYSHFSWVRQHWKLERGQRDLLECLERSIGRELGERGYDLSAAKDGRLMPIPSVTKFAKRRGRKPGPKAK